MIDMLRYAHRGIYNNETIIENTLKSFLATIKSEFDGIELDLRMIADGSIVVFHDKTLKRLFNKDDIVDYLNLKQLKNIFNNIIELEDVLDLVQKYNLKCILDIKNFETLIIDNIIKIILKKKNFDSKNITILVWNNSYQNQKIFKTYLAIETESVDNLLNIKNNNFDGICLPFTNTENNLETIKKIKKYNLDVNLYFKKYFLKLLENNSIKKLVDKITY